MIGYRAVPTQANGKPAAAAITSPGQSVDLPAIFNAWLAPSPTPIREDLPLVVRAYPPTSTPSPTPTPACPASSSASWGAMSPVRRFTAPSTASSSPDLNLRVRGWYTVNEPLGFAVYGYPPGQPPDTQNPLYLSHVVPGSSVASFVSVYQVSDWDWTGCDCPVPRNPSPYPVTMLGLRTTLGQPLFVPRRNLPVNDRGGFVAMVLYADARQLAFTYQQDDTVSEGYLVHLENLCVDPNLVALYQQLNSGGRALLPGVQNDSVVGTASGSEVDVVVRDSGSFLDPRSWQDWWQDEPSPTPTPTPVPAGQAP